MDILSIIEKKKNNKKLSKDEIFFWIENYCNDTISDYQVSALLMAITLNGMDEEETFNLTDAMISCSKTIDLSSIKGIKADKHSTGGVGDKTSLVLCPLLASCGLKIAKMSGRGLGFTGGTLDKLESIPGMNINYTSDEFFNLIKNNNLVIVGQSDDFAIADKKLYALRDVTGTISSKALIASSIMSKKLASGCDVLLLDVKYGNGAFMKTLADAEELAKLMIKIASNYKVVIKAEITSMEQPLGYTIGNALEVKEAIDTLNNQGPEDLTELCLSSAVNMLLMAKIYDDKDEAYKVAKQKLEDGSAFKEFKKFIKNQGGNESFIDNPSLFPTAKYHLEIKSTTEGYIKSINAHDLGNISMRLGAGRESLNDSIDIASGIILKKKIGDKVKVNDVLLEAYSERPIINNFTSDLLSTFEFSQDECQPVNLIKETISFNKEKNSFTIERK